MTLSQAMVRVLRRTPLAPFTRTLRYKRLLIGLYGARHGIRTLVETGTYMGDTVAALLHRFDRIYSIELQPALYEAAARRFAADARVHILLGDSGEVLPQLLPTLPAPCLFWLDGHYSAGATARGPRQTPIARELECILAREQMDDVILIDDVRCFTGRDDYPPLADVRAWIAERRPRHTVRVARDIIRATPPRPSARLALLPRSALTGVIGLVESAIAPPPGPAGG